MYAWETSFAKLVENIRSIEMRYVKYASCLKGVSGAFKTGNDKYILFLTLLIYVNMGNTLDAASVLFVSSMFTQLGGTCCILLPVAIRAFSEIQISIARIQVSCPLFPFVF